LQYIEHRAQTNPIRIYRVQAATRVAEKLSRAVDEDSILRTASRNNRHSSDRS